MAVSELSAPYVTPFDPRRRAPERRPPRESRSHPEVFALAEPDPALLTPVFRPDLSHLSLVAAPHFEPAPSAEVGVALDRLVDAVRGGDMGRARAAFEALETEMLVEHNAGHAEALAPLAGDAAANASSVHAADDIYETLAHYLDAHDAS